MASKIDPTKLCIGAPIKFEGCPIGKRRVTLSASIKGIHGNWVVVDTSYRNTLGIMTQAVPVDNITAVGCVRCGNME